MLDGPGEVNLLIQHITVQDQDGQVKLETSWCMLLLVSMEPWTTIKKALPQCGGDTNSCPDPYPMVACPQCHISCWLDQELFTLPSYKALLGLVVTLLSTKLEVLGLIPDSAIV